MPRKMHVDIFTVRKRSLRRLCFYTCLSVILFTGGMCVGRGGMHGGGGRHAWWGACVLGCVAGGMCDGGHVWQGGMCGREHAWQGHAWWGACVVGVCMAGGMHGGGMHGRGHAWHGGMHGMGACMAQGHAWHRGMHGRGACMAGWVCMAGGHVWWGMYGMAGGVCSGGVHATHIPPTL